MKDKISYLRYEEDFPIKMQVDRSKKLVGIVVIVLVVVGLTVGFAIAISNKNNQSNQSSAEDESGEILLLISLDGFKPEYLNFGLTPTLNMLASNGVQADFLRPVYPTKTFPNHYSIVTGLYPESHGIVSNNFRDKKFAEPFGLGKPTSFEAKWWGGEPIWITAMKNKMNAASFFWVGSEAVHPTYWRKYNKKTRWNDRVDQVVNWMKLKKEKRPSIITLYLEQPDSTSHRYGPFSNQSKITVQMVDTTMKYMVDELAKNKLRERVNIVIVSDHGMAPIGCSQLISLKQLNTLDDVKVVGLGASSLLYVPKDVNRTNLLQDLQCSNKHLLTFDKTQKTTPKRLHYQNNNRIGDLFLMPNEGWSILLNNDSCRSYIKGYHGIDNIVQNMQGIFIASGPAFRSNYKVRHFQNIEIYNLLADLLNITAAPNNGTKGSLNHILKPEYRKNISTVPLFPSENRLFPVDYTKALRSCTECVCKDCDTDVLRRMSMYRNNLNLTSNDIQRIHALQFPWSTPRNAHRDDNNTVVTLTQPLYVIGYDTALHLPVWVGYKLTKKQLPGTTNRKNCMRRDIRLNGNESSKCSFYQGSEFNMAALASHADFPSNRSDVEDTNILSNIVPQHPAFQHATSAWTYLEQVARNLTVKYKTIYITSGAIFDEDNDGIKDEIHQSKRWLNHSKNTVAIPTHFYKIFMKCKQRLTSADDDIAQCNSGLDILTFVLPHIEEEICKFDTMETYIQRHSTTLRDVELLTGLHFLSGLPVDRQASLKTSLNIKMW